MSDPSMGAGGDGVVETKGPQWRQLEASLATEQAEKSALKTQLDVYRQNAIQQAARLAGFQPNAEGRFEGPAGLLLGEFERTIGDAVPTVEAFTALAQQWGVTPPSAAQGSTDGSGGQPAAPTLGEQLAAMQTAGNGITQTGQVPGAAPSLDEQKAAALASNNVGLLLDLELANYRPAPTG